MTAEAFKTCRKCGLSKPEIDFVGRRGSVISYCASCRTKYDRSHKDRTYLGPCAVTESIALQKRNDRHLQIVNEFESERPRTRADCIDGERPCVWVGCRWNLYLDVSPDNGSIKFNHPATEPQDIDPERSCVLDIADRGGATLDDVGDLSNLTRERVRQIEEKGLGRARRLSKHRKSEAATLLQYCDAPDSTAPLKLVEGSAFREAEPEEPDGEGQQQELTSVSFFSQADDADVHVCRTIWTMFSRWQNGRGFDCRSRGQRASTQNLQQVRARKGELGEIKPPTHFNEEEDMATTETNGESELSPRMAMILAAYQDLASNGVKPSVMDVAIKAKVAGDTDKQKVQNTNSALYLLRKKGLLPNVAEKAVRAKPTPAKPRPAPKARAAVVRPKPPPAPKSGVLPSRSNMSSLEVLRAELATREAQCEASREAQCEALRDAISILDGVG